MINKSNFGHFFIISILSIVLFQIYTNATAAENYQVAVVVSKRIKPYMYVLEGMTHGWSQENITSQTIFLTDSNGKPNQDIADRLTKQSYDFFVAIGPEATQRVWSLSTDYPKLFTAVLDPDTVLSKSLIQCGISLRIPVDRQLQKIFTAFTNVKKIGLLFDAHNNNWFYEKVDAASRQYGIEIVPLRVQSKNQIAQVLTENWKKIDCVWLIPDQTVISEKIIQYIIKQGIYNNTGVIGYNSYFIRSGAVFSFDFDYKALGLQTANKTIEYFETRLCTVEPPEFTTVINRKMADKLGLKERE